MVLCCIFFFIFFFLFKDWICNKIEHCGVGMIFHSTLEPRFHLEGKTKRGKKHSSENLLNNMTNQSSALKHFFTFSCLRVFFLINFHYLTTAL